MNHPSYKNDMGCTELDISVAIGQSLMLGGTSVGVAYTEGSAEILSRECDWESNTEYAYRGTTSELDGERIWRIHLIG